MKKIKFLTIYSILILTVFASTILWFGVSLYKEYSSGYVRSRKTFDTMTASVKSTLQHSSEYSTDIQQKIESVIGSLNDYAFLDIKKNGKSVYTYSPANTIPEENTNMIKLYINTSKIGENTIYINAAMYTLRPSTISRNSKIAFVIILIFTLATVALIIYLNMTSKNELLTENSKDKEEHSEKEMPIYENKEEIKEEIVEENATETNIVENDENPNDIITNERKTEETSVDETIQKDNSIEDEAIQENNSNEDEIIQDDDGVFEQGFVQKSNEPTIEENNIEEKIEDNSSDDVSNENDPKGLFSPITGFGWEQYLLPRLDNELTRSSSLEFDLVLFLIKTKNIIRQAETIKPVSDLLIDSFQFKDFIFEYKDDCFAAIKTNCTIDDAIPLADKLHSDISKIISEKGGECFIGMTSKTIRLVSGERLLREAESALEHAQEDNNSPIIAFRVNAEKYREFVDKTN